MTSNGVVYKENMLIKKSICSKIIVKNDSIMKLVVQFEQTSN